MANYGFPGEQYLVEDLPDYAIERQMLLVKLVVTFFLWTMFMPAFLATEKKVITDDDKSGETTSDVTTMTTTTKSSSATGRTTRTTTTTKIVRVQHQKEKKKSIADKKKNRTSKKHNELGKGKGSKNSNSETDSKVRVISGSTNLLCCIGFILHAFYVFLKSSPDNYYTSRTVFETPMFTQDECDHLVDMAERVAIQNYHMAREYIEEEEREHNHDSNSSVNTTIMGYLKEPYGWQKTRHKYHATTDLNLVYDKFSDDDRAWIQQKLDARLAPTLERIFGVPPSALRANDIFVVRYDGDRQASLARHTDSGSITFSVLLSHGFEGGGTLYRNRIALDEQDNLGAPFTHVLPNAGMMTTFPAMIEHEGLQTIEGRRYLLIGFLAVDKIDPWTQRPTGLSWFASWGSINWASTKVKEGMEAAWMQKDKTFRQHDANRLIYSDQAREIFDIVHKLFIGICDVMFTHRFAVLVNETSVDDYLHDLDEAYKLKTQSSLHSPASNHQRSSWFAGQQISVNIDGTFSRNWKTREDTDAKFDGLQ